MELSASVAGPGTTPVLGRRRVFMVGVALFTLASTLVLLGSRQRAPREQLAPAPATGAGERGRRTP